MDDREVRRRVAALEDRLADLEGLDEPARSVSLEAVQQLVELYGEALARLLTHARSATAESAVARHGAAGDAAAFDRALAGDELLAHLLLLHELHPEAAGARLEAALAALRPQLVSRGATVELSGVEDGVARLRFQASAPLPEKLIELFEEAVRAAAPELTAVESGGAVARKDFVSIGSLKRKAGVG